MKARYDVRKKDGSDQDGKERRYFVINIDEPYAEEIFEVFKRGQMVKGEWPEGDVNFEEWKLMTWPEDPQSLSEQANLDLAGAVEEVTKEADG